MRQWHRTTPHDWWRRRPFLPIPTADYRAFRMVTQYGDPDRAPVPADVLNYLLWCKRVQR